MKTKVIINGAGPTGLTLAAQLLRHNIGFIILDRNERPTHLSKAMVVHARTLEIFNELGLADKAVATGQIGQQFTLITDGKIKGKLKLGEYGKGLSQFPFVLMLEQSKTEKLLADYIYENGGHIHWNSDYFRHEENENSVTVFYKDANGQEQQIRGDYLIGCDGAASAVRHELGLTFEGDTEARIFYVADVKIESKLTQQKDAYFVMIENGFALFFPMEGENHYRVIGTVPEDFNDKEKFQFSDIRENISNQIQTPVKFVEEYWFSTYKVHSRKAKVFKKGRCFIAGDAAHIHTPAGGQGMNTGIQDAYNLAWKLAFVIDGKASEKLLDSYNEERSANAIHLLKTTDRMFDVIAGKSFITNFFRIHIVPFFLNMLSATNLIRRIFPLLSQIGIKYPQSSITIKSKVGKIAAGDRMPYFTVNGGSIFERLKDPNYKILYFGNNGDEKLQGVMHSKIDPVKLAFAENPEVFGHNSGFFVIIRPDNHIAYLGNDVSKVNRALII